MTVTVTWTHIAILALALWFIMRAFGNHLDRKALNHELEDIKRRLLRLEAKP